MITIIQVLIILFAAFAWSRAFLRLKNNNISVREFILWSIIWAAIIIIGLLPSLIQSLSNVVGIERGTDLAIYISIIALFYLVFRIYVKIDVQNQELTKLVREIAIQRVKKKK